MNVSQYHPQPPTAASHPTLRKRILRMMRVWAVLGALMGAGAGLEGGGFVGAIAGMIAGMVELAVLGAGCALIGGRPGESVAGAVVGFLTGLTVGIVARPAPVVLATSFGLVFGAIAGATLRPYLNLLSLPFILLGRLLRRHQPPALMARSRMGLLSLDRAGRSIYRRAVMRRAAVTANPPGRDPGPRPTL
jgi:hypothetical protein